MRYGYGTAEFDYSDHDLKHDTLDEILDVAVSVLDDYGSDPGDTRIERMARYLIGNLGEPLKFENAQEIILSDYQSVSDWGGIINVYDDYADVAVSLPYKAARTLATAILRLI